jgi:hypothetical protein
MTDNFIKFAVIGTMLVTAFTCGVGFSHILATHSTQTVTYGSAPSGLAATQRVATSTQVGPGNATKVFSASPNCAARLIRTQSSDIYILFADPTNGDLASTTLSGVASFTQAASTTVSYDGALYGCGAVYIKSPTASTTLTVADFL